MFIDKSILAFAAVLSTAAIAHAAPVTSETDVPRMTVRYGDLNLATSSGVHTLYDRMQTASRAACANFGEGNSVSDRRINQACRDQLVQLGVEKMNSRALTALASKGAAPIEVASH